MCRHLAWVGEPRTLADVVLTGERSLLVQSYAPLEQRYGTVNADGYGVGWYAPARAEPARVRRAVPIWTDASLASMAGVVESGCVMAAVRSATVGSPIEETATAPFAGGRWLFSHNGSVPDFPSVAPKLRSLLPDDVAAGIESTVDSALLWTMTRWRLESGATLGEALAEVVGQVAGLAGGRLNLLVTDGRQIAATTFGDTLYVRQAATGVEVSSEPTTPQPPAGPSDSPIPSSRRAAHPGSSEDSWYRVPDGSLLTATPNRLTVIALPTP